MKKINFPYKNLWLSRNKKSVWNTSFAASLIKVFLLVYIPLLCVSMYITYQNEKVMNDRQLGLYIQDLQFTTKKMEAILEGYQNIACSIVSDKQTEILNAMPDSPVSLFEMVSISDKLGLFSAPTDLKNRLFLFLPNKKKVITTVPSAIHDAERSDLIVTNNWDITDFSVKPASVYENVRSDGKMLTFSYSNTLQNPIICQSVVYAADIKNFLSQSLPKGAQAMYIKDNDNDYIFYSGNSMSDAVLSDVIGTSKNTSRFSFKDYLILQEVSSRYPLTMSVVLDKHLLSALSVKRYTINVLLISFLTLFAVFCLKLMHRSILHPLYRLYHGMKKLSQGDLTVQIREDPRTKDFNFMYTQFNYTVAKISELIEMVNIEHLKYQEAQVKFLHAQINPHFLYNCLSFIYQMSLSGDNEPAAEMSLYLGKFFRYTTKMNAIFVPLEEELNNIDTYMNIQKLRLTYRLNYSCNSAENILHIEVPKLSLLSLVENSIKHGIEPSFSQCDIQINAYEKDNIVYIDIMDTGLGMEQAKIDELNTFIGSLRLSDPDTNSSFGDGIINPYLRFKYKYGPETSYHIQANIDRGIMVKISFPVKKGDLSCSTY